MGTEGRSPRGHVGACGRGLGPWGGSVVVDEGAELLAAARVTQLA